MEIQCKYNELPNQQFMSTHQNPFLSPPELVAPASPEATKNVVPVSRVTLPIFCIAPNQCQNGFGV